MFVGKVPCVDKTQEVLLKLDDSHFDFHLTGSRYFGGFSQNSDYDFFVRNSEEIVAFLESIGFVKEECSNYQASIGLLCDTVAIYAHPFCRIHIQLVTDTKLRSFIAHKLDSSMIMVNADKKTKSKIWQLAYTLCNSKFVVGNAIRTYHNFLSDDKEDFED
jgi:hypothetical protein